MALSYIEAWLDNEVVGCGWRRFLVIGTRGHKVRLLDPTSVRVFRVRSEELRGSREVAEAIPEKVAALLERNLLSLESYGRRCAGALARAAIADLRGGSLVQSFDDLPDEGEPEAPPAPRRAASDPIAAHRAAEAKERSRVPEDLATARLRVVVTADRARKPGSSIHTAYARMEALVASEPGVTVPEIIARTPYKMCNISKDLERGNIEIVGRGV